MNGPQLTIQSKSTIDSSIHQAIRRALAGLLSTWSEIGSHDVVVYVDDEPKAAIIPFADYQTLRDREILQDIRDGREAQVVYEEWLENPDTARPYAEFRTEMLKEGLLDE